MTTAEPGAAEVELAIKELLREEEIGALATISADGYPSTATMHFASDGLAVYMHTFTYTRKYADIQRDQRVSYALHHLPPAGFDGRFEVRAVQVKGTATIVTDQAEIERAVEVSYEQFDWLKDTTMYDNFKRAGQAQRQVFFRIDPVQALWTDHRVRMLWRTIVNFSADGQQVAGLEPYAQEADQGLLA
jgi:general stress protein 26